MQLATYYPHTPMTPVQTTYSVPIYRDQVIRVPDEPLPIPPRHPFWADYCTSVDTWVQSGKDDIETMAGSCARAASRSSRLERFSNGVSRVGGSFAISAI